MHPLGLVVSSKGRYLAVGWSGGLPGCVCASHYRLAGGIEAPAGELVAASHAPLVAVLGMAGDVDGFVIHRLRVGAHLT